MDQRAEHTADQIRWNEWAYFLIQNRLLEPKLTVGEAFKLFQSRGRNPIICDPRLLTFVQKTNQGIIPIGSPLYPSGFYQLRHPPLVLFWKGNVSLLQHNAVAIVGTRRATPIGKSRTNLWARDLSRSHVIVSGLASGIDQAAHEGALPNTIAILGFGHDYHYPSENRWLRVRIEDEGGLTLSHHTPWTRPYRHAFLDRNYLIAALSQKLIVIEAPQRSGALHTARIALELHGNVFAVPGSPEQLHYTGNIRLIQEGAWPLFQPEELSNRSSG